jgi:hypothetical protein
VPAATEVVDGELVVRAGDEGGLLAAQSTHPPSRTGTAGRRQVTQVPTGILLERLASRDRVGRGEHPHP